jgi:tetratricopeptide (TPR) repeat protein
VIDLLERIAGLERGDSSDEKLGKLERLLGRYQTSLEVTGPLFASLLSVPTPEGRYPPLNLSPQRQREKTLEALLAILVEEATREPLLLIAEDLHWIDPSSLEFLELLVGQTPSASICTLLTARPAFQSPWGSRSYLTQVTLNRLPGGEVEELVERVTGGKALPSEVTEQLVAKTDGVPLFVEEVTKTVLESGLLKEVDGRYELTGPMPPLVVPATLQDSLMARLDRFASTKTIAQLGATIGREFSDELLQAVSPWSQQELRQGLRQLVNAELVYQRGLPPRATYRFKHALIQEAAYESLLKSTRQSHHQRIAEVLKGRFPEIVETQPELLALHLTEAGLGEEAVDFWRQAGARAHQRSAYVEAIAHLRKGLEVFKTLPDTAERAEQELTLLNTLRPPLVATKGSATPEVEPIITRVEALLPRVKDRGLTFWTLGALQTFYFQRGGLPKAREIADRFYELAQRWQRRPMLVWSHSFLGQALYLVGDFEGSRKHCEQGMALYDPERDRPQVTLAINDPGIATLGFLTRDLWLLGYPDQARQRTRQCLALAQELSHPYTLTMARSFSVSTHLWFGEHHFVRQQVDGVLAAATEQRNEWFVASGTFWRGWVLVAEGQGEEGLAQMRQGLAAVKACGIRLGLQSLLWRLAEEHRTVGQSDEGLRVLAEATAAADDSGECTFEAEVHRLRGELLLPQNDPSQQQAEACFHRALEVARRQQAKSLELRATISLSRLWQRQGKWDEARKLLGDIYGWFTEGFDTADLKAAKALLEELRG